MGNLAAVTAAFILRTYGINIFREPKDVGGGPLFSSYFFLFASYLLLYDLRLYPKSLRALGKLSQFIIEVSHGLYVRATQLIKIANLFN